jgi:peroxiredoxin
VTADPRLTHPELREDFEAAERRWFANWRRGPTRRRWQELPLQGGDAAPDLTLLDSDGVRTPLSSLWMERPALLLFWRHWGCGCGTDRAARLATEHAKLVEAGATVAVIGQGGPGRAAWYREAFGLPCKVLVDDDESAYRAFGLLEMSPWLLISAETQGPDRLNSIIEEFREKGRPVADNPFLLPGEFVVDKHGRLVLTYRYQYCDNAPDEWTLLDSIAEAVAAG